MSDNSNIHFDLICKHCEIPCEFILIENEVQAIRCPVCNISIEGEILTEFKSYFLNKLVSEKFKSAFGHVKLFNHIYNEIKDEFPFYILESD